METFLAEIRKVEARKLVSGDIEILVTFNTSDNRALDLGKFPSDTLFRVYVQDVDSLIDHVPVKTQLRIVKSQASQPRKHGEVG